MTIRNYKDEDKENLLKLFKEFFAEHNVFSKTDEEVKSYLEEQDEKNSFLVLEEEGDIKATVVLVEKGGTPDNSHKLWKLRHFAYKDEEKASELIKETEKRIKEDSESSKIIVFIAEGEKSLNFFNNNGYSEEGNISDLYREGENCKILGKKF